MKKKTNSIDNQVLGRRNFIQGASMAAASLSLPSALRARQNPTPAPPGGDVGITPPRHTMIYINLRGGADGLTMLAPAGDTFYKRNRHDFGVDQGTRIKDMAPNIQLGSTGWWLPKALAPLKEIYDANHLAAIPAVGMVNQNQSHFVAMDLMELGVPPTTGVYPDSGFIARALDRASFSSAPPLRGLVMSPKGTTSFLRAPKSLAIPNVTKFDFPAPAAGMLPPDAEMITAVQTMHTASPSDILKDASATTFDTIDYLKDAFASPPGVQAVGPLPENYPENSFGVQLRRAAQLILSGNPPEVIEIDVQGWDHHNQQWPNRTDGIMYARMETLARGLRAFHQDMSTSAHPLVGDTWMDHVTCMTISEFGRRIRENTNQGTDHGKAGAMFVVGGKRLNGGVRDAHWVGGLAGMKDGSSVPGEDPGDVRLGVEYRDLFGEAFVKLFNVSTSDLTNLVFEGHNYQPIQLFS